MNLKRINNKKRRNIQDRNLNFISKQNSLINFTPHIRFQGKVYKSFKNMKMTQWYIMWILFKVFSLMRKSYPFSMPKKRNELGRDKLEIKGGEKWINLKDYANKNKN